MRKALFVMLATGTIAALIVPVGSAQAAPSPVGLEHRAVHSCASPTAGDASCDALFLMGVSSAAQPAKGKPKPPPTPATPQGYGPADLQAAYNVAQAASAVSGATVAIVDAYDDPTAEADLGT